MKLKYLLRDTFNDCNISRHSSLENALLARYRHLKAVKKANGANSYLTYEILQKVGEEYEKINQNEEFGVEHNLIEAGKI